MAGQGTWTSGILGDGLGGSSHLASVKEDQKVFFWMQFFTALAQVLEQVVLGKSRLLASVLASSCTQTRWSWPASWFGLAKVGWCVKISPLHSGAPDPGYTPPGTG